MDLYFITGTSSGLGYALTHEVLKQGNRVVGIGRKHPHNATNYWATEADLSRVEAASSLSLSDPWQASRYERVILVNNAGVIEPVKHMGHANAQSINNHYQVNLVAPTILINQFLAEWENSSPELVIINVSSGAAHRPIDGWGPYCSAKSGLSMLTQVVHEENQLRNRNCRVYALAPGVVDTPMQETIRSADPSEFSQLERFRELKEQEAMEKPNTVARKFIDVVEYKHTNLATVDRLN
jgi:benzil reductase ((S)-benzoin forming)